MKDIISVMVIFFAFILIIAHEDKKAKEQYYDAWRSPVPEEEIKRQQSYPLPDFVELIFLQSSGFNFLDHHVADYHNPIKKVTLHKTSDLFYRDVKTGENFVLLKILADEPNMSSRTVSIFTALNGKRVIIVEHDRYYSRSCSYPHPNKYAQLYEYNYRDRILYSTPSKFLFPPRTTRKNEHWCAPVFPNRWVREDGFFLKYLRSYFMSLFEQND